MVYLVDVYRYSTEKDGFEAEYCQWAAENNI